MSLFIAEIEFEMKSEWETIEQARKHFRFKLGRMGLHQNSIKNIREVPEDGTTWT